MKKIFNQIKYLKLYDLFSIFIFLLILLPSLFYKFYLKIIHKNIWLVCEDGLHARDNGYCFFQYIRTMHPKVECYYVIDKKSSDYKKVKEFGNIIQFRSFKHWLYYLCSKYNISSQKNGNPAQPLFYLLHVNLNLFNNRVFLQHGITKDDAEWLYYKNTKFKYFLCGAKEEYDFIKEKFGYPKDNLIYTGFPRFDNLYNYNLNKNQILIMPTWRNWLGRETNSLGEKYIFEETDYYKYWNELLNNEDFINFIENNDLKVLFYPHMNMQKYLNCFKVKSNNIEIVSMNTDIQKVLKESAIMITDYSSVFMDFAYMLKPILFYQFDYEEFREKQYEEGYYNYKDGFGPSLSRLDDLIDKLKKVYKFGIEDKYLKRMKKFFELKDQKNCERLYKILKKQ